MHFRITRCILERNRSKLEGSMEEHLGKEIFKLSKSLQSWKNDHRIIYLLICKTEQSIWKIIRKEFHVRTRHASCKLWRWNSRKKKYSNINNILICDIHSGAKVSTGSFFAEKTLENLSLQLGGHCEEALDMFSWSYTFHHVHL